jgi:hypothetical protein
MASPQFAVAMRILRENRVKNLYVMAHLETALACSGGYGKNTSMA